MAEQDNLYRTPQSEILNTQRSQDELILHVPKSLSIGYGWRWLREGFELFKTAPMTWIGLTIIYFLIFMIIGLIPLAGNFLPSLLSPIFMAGIIIGCHAQKNNDPLTISHLFAGFKNNTEQLLLIGLFMLILTIIAFIPLIVVMGAMFFEIFTNANNPDLDLALFNSPDFAVKMILGVLISLAIYVPVLMTIWFSPALAAMHNIPAIEAMKMSFKGCIKNIMPFLWYGVITFLLMIVASIPLFLGWFILAPIMMATLYTSYTSVFTNAE